MTAAKPMTARRSLRDLPVGRKLLGLGLALTAAVLVAITGFSAVTRVIDWRTQAVAQLGSQAKIVAANSASAVLFADRAAAAETLGALRSAPGIAYAGVYDADGRLFVSFGDRRWSPKGSVVPLAGDAMSERVTPAALVVTAPIVLHRQSLGTIYLASDMHPLIMKIAGQTGVLILVAAFAFGLSTILFSRMLRGIVGPLVDLTRLTQEVSSRHDYSLRATPASGDEIGILARSFNDMLGVVQDRDTLLAQHQARLEETVRRRTGELNDANLNLGKELSERKAAQDVLHAHDAMLKAVASSAGVLLGSVNLNDAIVSVLELMGQTLAVGRVLLASIVTDSAGHLRSSVRQEWFAPGLARRWDDPLLKEVDLTSLLPSLAAGSLLGERATLVLADMPAPARALFAHDGVMSMLFIPVMAEGKLWGGLWFMDSAPVARVWSWAETDTLASLAGLIGVSNVRQRYVRELADANTIVQNSPTVLFRIKGDPLLKLTYISHNIKKFGIDPKTILMMSINSILPILVHPDDLKRVFETMQSLVTNTAEGLMIEFRLMQPAGGFRWVETRFTPVRDDLRRLVEIEGILVDITDRKAAEDKIALMARTDSLTGLDNRATFVERLHRAFASSKRDSRMFAVLYLDLDHFKDINDTRGHPVGDLLLKEVAARLRSRVRETDVVARIGGDEFAILQMDIAEPADAGALGTAIVDALGAPYMIGADELHITASVGIAPLTAATANPDSMLAQADLALYRAKDDGRNLYRFHTEELDREVNERMAIAAELRKAVSSDELYLDYQPQVELHSGKIVGMEALVRWRHPARGILKPADFLPIAELTGMSEPVGRWVLGKACAQMKIWREAGVAPPVIAVNVSMMQLKNGAEFVRDVIATLNLHGVKTSELEFDVTESMLAKVTLTRNDVLERLADLGVRLALDDFGTEYSTFEYLRAYRVSNLKVAKQFIEHAARDKRLATTVRAIISAAHELGINVIAEGVETQEQRSLLLSLGRSTNAQGFLFSEPVDPARATELLRTGAIPPLVATTQPVEGAGASIKSAA